MKLVKITFLLGILAIFTSCNTNVVKEIIVKNDLKFARSFETIEITKANLSLDATDNLYDYSIEDSKEILQVVQYEDTNGDDIVDTILFQPNVSANSSTTYQVIHTPNAELPEREEICYSRFVPERTDDYAWENDKVAFRVYGPTAQKMKETGVEGGTLSSGIDCWLKRVEYPIINKWYKKHADKTGTYHKDTGEGLDNYHVGTSRGCGGIAVKEDSTYAISKNYIAYKTITTGPIRTQFSLEYADWDANGKLVKESRVLTLDKGNNLTKHTIFLDGIDQVSIGLTLHSNAGIISKNKKRGWISYWEKLDDSEIGTAVLLSDPNDLVDFDTYISEKEDVKNQFLKSKINNKEITYYSGFAWKKSKEITNGDMWNVYLKKFSKQLASPLEITIK